MDTKKIKEYVEEFFGSVYGFSADKWRYEDGAVMRAAEELYSATGDGRLKDLIISYADSYTYPDGSIKTYRPDEQKLDDILPGHALIFAYSETSDERYKKAAFTLLKELENHPRTASGSMWHKKIYPNQVWLDGLYMAQPFRMACDTRFGKKDSYFDILGQFERVRENMRDPKTGLYYHGFDESRSVFWADPGTGLSKSFWLRAMGWYLMALADTAEETDSSVYEVRRALGDIYKEAIKGILNYADPDTGLFWQVADKPDLLGNYLETSGSAMVAASIFKACRLRLVLEDKYIPFAERILESLSELKLVRREGRLILADTCAVAGLGPDPGRRDGTPEYYLSEPRAENEPKGAAAFIMAYAQYLKYIDYKNGPRRKPSQAGR